MSWIPYDWAWVACPKCGAGPQSRCRTLATGRTTDAHSDRIEAAIHRDNYYWGGSLA
ncbi:zinc finger domain-containing protein [Mycobacteroides abscessus]|uniref:zinc finger domain-containing protein n=1 Tax=Mycobacteroides abscessus TaxID=36809 RepID=UPI003B43093D